MLIDRAIYVYQTADGWKYRDADRWRRYKTAEALIRTLKRLDEQLKPTVRETTIFWYPSDEDGRQEVESLPGEVKPTRSSNRLA